MAETTIENQVCRTCGAGVRSGAFFCYSCGSAVSPETKVALKDEKTVGNVSFPKTLAEENNNGQTAKLEQPIIEQTVADKSVLKPNANEEPKLKSAAAMRRKSKIYQPKKIEVIWEEHENAPNGWFITVAIVLTLLAAGIFYLAIYLK